MYGVAKLLTDICFSEYEVAKMTKDLQEKEITLSKMAMKLISLKQKIDSVESVLCKYFVKKLYKVFPSDDAQVRLVLILIISMLIMLHVAINDTKSIDPGRVVRYFSERQKSVALVRFHSISHDLSQV